MATSRCSSVLPLFVTAFLALWLALAVNLVGLVAAAGRGDGLVPDPLDGAATWIGLYAFLVPVSVAMAARTFPIFLRTQLPRLPALRVGLALLLGSLVLRLSGDATATPLLAGLGRLGLAAALALFVLALGVFGRRRPLPRADARPHADPVRAHMLSAYVWLVGALGLLALAGLHALGVAALPASTDAERHALGSGFVTLLILGAGAFLLPGMTGRRVRSRGLLWPTLLLANTAALLRVLPVALPGIVPAPALRATLTLAGITGLGALLLFALNVVVGRPPRPP